VDAGEIPVRVVRPPSTPENETFPLVMYMLGGGALSHTASRSAGASAEDCAGFWAGDIDLRDYWLCYLSSKVKIVTINVGYLCGFLRSLRAMWRRLSCIQDRTMSAPTRRQLRRVEMVASLRTVQRDNTVQK
jgi:hypothetical protein